LRCGPRDCPTNNRPSSQSSLGNGRQRLGFAVRGQTQLTQHNDCGIDGTRRCRDLGNAAVRLVDTRSYQHYQNTPAAYPVGDVRPKPHCQAARSLNVAPTRSVTLPYESDMSPRLVNRIDWLRAAALGANDGIVSRA
jgi:hypothetical protein